jgi:predicted RNA-binding protein YlqC (UPF0109 family)
LIHLVGYIARHLGAHPRSIELDEEPGPDGSSQITLQAHPDDLPALIGRNGRTIRAIRALMAISSAKSGRRATLSLDAALGSDPSPDPPPRGDEDFGPGGGG